MSLLKLELSKIDWQANIDAALAAPALADKIDLCAKRNAIWIVQISLAEPNNPAKPFLVEVASLSQQAPALACCGYYRSAVSSARSIVESALYYTYFRSHPRELASLLRDPKYYISKGDVLDFHRQHTVNFNSYQTRLGLVSNLDLWYQKVSAITHSQIPGAMTGGLNLSDIKYEHTLFSQSMDMIFDAWVIVEALFFSTLSQELWRLFAPDAKDQLTKGMSADTRAALGLDKK